MRVCSVRRGAAMALALGVAGTGLSACQTATYGTGEAPEATLLREMTGGLIGGRDAPPIAYRPRSPLVLPPTAELRTPEPPAAERADGDWPRDPDRQRASLLSGEPAPEITPEYVAGLEPLRQAMRGHDRDYTPPPPEIDTARSFATQRNQRQQFQAAIAERDGHSSTERRYLTDPPSHYRQPAETAPTEFEDVEARRPSFFARLFGRS